MITLTIAPAGRREAMVNVIMNQCAFRISDGLLDSLQLLCEIKTRSPPLHHSNNSSQMPFCALEPLNNGRMRGMLVLFHAMKLSSPRGYKQQHFEFDVRRRAY